MELVKKESIILQVISLIIVFTASFIIVYGLNYYVADIRSEYDKQISNSRAKLSLGESLSNKLFIIEDCNIKISNTSNMAIVNFYSKKIYNSIVDFEKILKVLQRGGTYEKTVSVTVAGKNQIQEKYNYYREDNSYNIEVIELSTKIVDIRKISGLIIQKVKIKLNDTGNQLLTEEQSDIDILLKQIETFFRRSHETVNVIFYNNALKINELTLNVNESKKELDYFSYIVYLSTFLFAFVLTRLILKKIARLIREKQEYLLKVEQSHKAIQDIFDAMPVGVMLVDKKREISRINKTALSLIDTENYDDVLCSSCKSIFSINQEVSCPYDDNIKLDEVEIDLITSKGNTIPVIKNVIPITINDEKFLLEAFMDISKQKEVESLLKIALKKAEESDQLKTEFIHNMTHEIRTPLNGIIGFSELLENTNLTLAERKEHLKIIKESGSQLNQIIEDILEIAELETKQYQIIETQVSLNEIMLTQFSIFDIKAKEKNLILQLHKGLSDGECIILTDEIKLSRIIYNLIENSIKFTNKGSINIGYEIINKNIEIFVNDTGIGIKPECHSTIFDRFSQEEKEVSKNVGGLGLGLSIAKENSELLGGGISVQSVKGEGATFVVTIPFKSIDYKAVTNHPPIKDNTDKKVGKNTILIVEDERINYLFLSMLLKNLDLNLSILHAKNGKEAVEMCGINNAITLVLMDLKMPIMSGFEATTLIKGLRPGLPIIAQTAYSTERDRQKAISAGCDNFISKPIKKEVLLEAINKFL